ncbi:WD40 repeat domain-containing protein [Streptomyces sp. NPDC002143]
MTGTGSGYRLELRFPRTRATLARHELGPLTTPSRDSTPLLAFSPDGTALAVADTTASGGPRQRVTVWDTRPRTAGTLPGFSGDVLAVRPDGRLTASSDEQSATLPSGPVTGRALADGRNVTALAFSPDGSRLAVGDFTGRVLLWDGEARHRTDTLTGDEIRSVAFSRDGGTLYVSGPHVPPASYLVSPEQAVRTLCTRMGSDGLSRAGWKAYAPDVPYRAVCG